MSMDLPKVTVLMPVYNGEKYLEEAIKSVLSQTFRDFEFIVIDGGSTDSTPAILARYQQTDNRIRVYYQENQKLVASLNMGCQLARAEYIARMDADDLSLPERLAKQVAYLGAHPEVGVLGTLMEKINESGKPAGNWRAPTAPNVIAWSLMFYSCVGHPSVMMRRDVIERLGFYRLEALQAEDYDLWARASFATQIANIPEILVRYRVWQAGSTARHSEKVEQYTVRVMHSMIVRLLGSDVSLETVSSLRQVVIGLPLANSQQVDEVATLVKQLHRAYLNTTSLNRAETREVAQDAGMRLLALAASDSKISLVKRFRILVQALRLSPCLFWSKQVIAKGPQKGLRMLLGRAYSIE
jgi:glycosyltransferase involved in cell wall biosynthesis